VPKEFELPEEEEDMAMDDDEHTDPDLVWNDLLLEELARDEV
jgi:hypothetical protein